MPIPTLRSKLPLFSMTLMLALVVQFSSNADDPKKDAPKDGDVKKQVDKAAGDKKPAAPADKKPDESKPKTEEKKSEPANQEADKKKSAKKDPDADKPAAKKEAEAKKAGDDKKMKAEAGKKEEPPKPKSIFPDKGLEMVVRAEVFEKRYNAEPITAEDVVDIPSIDVRRLNKKPPTIKSLEGLQHCKALMEIDLSDNEISDLTPLAELTRLQSVTLAGNKITHVRALGEPDRNATAGPFPKPGRSLGPAETDDEAAKPLRFGQQADQHRSGRQADQTLVARRLE